MRSSFKNRGLPNINSAQRKASDKRKRREKQEASHEGRSKNFQGTQRSRETPFADRVVCWSFTEMVLSQALLYLGAQLLILPLPRNSLLFPKITFYY